MFLMELISKYINKKIIWFKFDFSNNKYSVDGSNGNDSRRGNNYNKYNNVFFFLQYALMTHRKGYLIKVIIVINCHICPKNLYPRTTEKLKRMLGSEATPFRNLNYITGIALHWIYFDIIIFTLHIKMKLQISKEGKTKSCYDWIFPVIFINTEHFHIKDNNYFQMCIVVYLSYYILHFNFQHKSPVIAQFRKLLLPFKIRLTLVTHQQWKSLQMPFDKV